MTQINSTICLMCQITVFLKEFWSYAKFSFAYTDTESSVSKENKYLDLTEPKLQV